MRVMRVGEMRVTVTQSRMAVPVGVRLPRIDSRLVRVLMVKVVPVAMAVFDIMPVLMGMAFGQVQPDAKPHQSASEREL